MKQCPICGKAFEPLRSNQPTCGDTDCRTEWRKIYYRNYMKKRRVHKNEYNRRWMAEYRAKQKQPKEPIKDFAGLDYAERQKRKSLALAGEIKL